jgi:hypothetical protein
VATFSRDPDTGAGEWRIEEPFSHIIAAPGSRQRVVVWGPGTDDGTPTGHPLYAVAHNAGRPVQPTVYQTDPGRSGKPYYSEDITSVTQAQTNANKIETRSWASLRTLRFRTRRPTLPGETVRVRVLPEGINENFRVTEVSTVPGVIRKYDITIGMPMPDFNALLQRRARKEHALQQLAALGLPLPGGQTGKPGAARRQPIHSTPQNIYLTENVIRPGDPLAAGLILRTPFTQPGAPPPGYDDYENQLRTQAYNATSDQWEDAFWTDGQTQRPHPYVVDFGYITTDGTYGKHLPYRVIMRKLDLKGTGTVQLQRNGVNVGSPATVSGTWQIFPLSNPWLPGDDLHVVVSGTSGTGVSIMVWEG